MAVSVLAQERPMRLPVPCRVAGVDVLHGLGLPHDRIGVSLERYMRCGKGSRGQCMIDHSYGCIVGAE